MTKQAGARRVADGFTAAGGPVAAADAFETVAASDGRSGGAASRSKRE
jgi:hypothetical protein